MPDPDFERELRRLRENYRPQLRRDLVALDASLREARGSDDKQLLETARRLAHRVKGTSGSYGLTEVSAPLAAIEARLVDLLGSVVREPGGAWEEIQRGLEQARAAAEAGGRPPE